MIDEQTSENAQTANGDETSFAATTIFVDYVDRCVVIIRAMF